MVQKSAAKPQVRRFVASSVFQQTDILFVKSYILLIRVLMERDFFCLFYFGNKFVKVESLEKGKNLGLLASTEKQKVWRERRAEKKLHGDAHNGFHLAQFYCISCRVKAKG